MKSLHVVECIRNFHYVSSLRVVIFVSNRELLHVVEKGASLPSYHGFIEMLPGLKRGFSLI